MNKADLGRRSLSRAVELAGFSLLRAISEYRAWSDLFVPRYSKRIDWQSGLGDSVYSLYGLVRSLHPQVIVEIGSARGRSTCALALACKQNGHGITYGIDPHTINPWTEIGTGGNTEAFLRDRLKDYHLDEWCRVMVMTSIEAAKTWSKPIDLLFIDGDHSFEGVRADFETFKPWLKPGALVIFHDTAWSYYTPPETEALRGDFREKLESISVPRYMELMKHEGYRSITLPAPPGLTILDPKIGGFVFCPAARDDGIESRPL